VQSSNFRNDSQRKIPEIMARIAAGSAAKVPAVRCQFQDTVTSFLGPRTGSRAELKQKHYPDFSFLSPKKANAPPALFFVFAARVRRFPFFLPPLLQWGGAMERT
jgi:hypothetical protein